MPGERGGGLRGLTGPRSGDARAGQLWPELWTKPGGVGREVAALARVAEDTGATGAGPVHWETSVTHRAAHSGVDGAAATECGWTAH